MLGPSRNSRPAAGISWSSPIAGAGLAVLLGAAVGVAVVIASPVILVAVLAGIAGVLVLVRSAQAGLLAFIAVASLVPFAVIPVRVGAQLTLVDAILTITLLAWLTRSLARRDPLVDTPANGPVVLFMGLAVAAFVLGLAQTPEPEVVRRFLKYLNSILFFFSVVNIVRERWQIEQAVRWLVVGGALAAAIAVVLYYLPRDTTVRLLSTLRAVGYPSGAEVLRFIPADNNTYSDTLRATGTSIDPNVLGGLLMLAGTLALNQLLARRPLLPRAWVAGMSVLMMVAIFLTYSRSSLVGLVSGLLFVATLRYRRVWLGVFAIVLALLYLPQGQAVLERLASGLAGQDKAAAMRLGEYRDALTLIARYPLLGVGFGAAPDVDIYVAVSSIYLLIAEQMGLLGLGAFLVAVGVLLVGSLQAAPAIGDEGARALLTGLQAALVAALVAGLFDHYLANQVFPHAVALFWLYCGLLAAAMRASTEG